MSDFNWCHGPECHKEKTVDRVRGVKGSKVLRTRKIKLNNWNKDWWTKYFCDQTCLMRFIHEHYQEFIRLHPRLEALETPINVTKENYDHGYYGNRQYTKIEVDESRNTG